MEHQAHLPLETSYYTFVVVRQRGGGRLTPLPRRIERTIERTHPRPWDCEDSWGTWQPRRCARLHQGQAVGPARHLPLPPRASAAEVVDATGSEPVHQLIQHRVSAGPALRYRGSEHGPFPRPIPTFTAGTATDRRAHMRPAEGHHRTARRGTADPGVPTSEERGCMKRRSLQKMRAETSSGRSRGSRSAWWMGTGRAGERCPPHR